MFTDYQRIRGAIRQALDLGRNNFIIYPYGEYGVMTKQILNDSFGIKEAAIIDNQLAAYNVNIKTLSECQNLEKSKYTVLFTCANPDVYYEALNNLMQYFPRHFVIEIFQMEKERGGGYTMRKIQLWTVMQSLADRIGWGFLQFCRGD